MSAAEQMDVAPEDRLRADLYNFMGLILAGPPDEMLLAQTASLSGDESDLGQAIKHDDAMPFRLFYLLARLLVFPGIRGRNAEVGQRTAAWHVLGIRVRTEVSNQDHFINAACHARLLQLFV